MAAIYCTAEVKVDLSCHREEVISELKRIQRDEPGLLADLTLSPDWSRFRREYQMFGREALADMCIRELEERYGLINPCFPQGGVR